MEFNKEDLIWEAVRRNEYFKQDCLFYWKEISLFGKFNTELHDEFCNLWKVGFIPKDSDMNIQEIKDKISENQHPPYTIHPYYSYFKHGHKAVSKHNFSQIKIQKKTTSKEKDIIEIKGRSLILFELFYNRIKDRILISINPEATDEEINNEIKKIKRAENLKRKEKIPEKGDRLYNPKEIDKYMNWLKQYDHYVDLIRRDYEKSIKITNGIILKPKGLTYNDLVTIEEINYREDCLVELYLYEILKKELKLSTKPPKKDFRKPSKFNSFLENINNNKELYVKIKDCINEFNKINGHKKDNTYIHFSNFLKEKRKFKSLKEKIRETRALGSVNEDLRRVKEQNIKDAIKLIQKAPNIEFN